MDEKELDAKVDAVYRNVLALCRSYGLDVGIHRETEEPVLVKKEMYTIKFPNRSGEFHISVKDRSFADEAELVAQQLMAILFPNASLDETIREWEPEK